MHNKLLVKDKAYCPYSNFRVGAALLDENGVWYTGNLFDILYFEPF